MIDIVLLVIVGGSALLGLLRGLVGTLVSTAAWLLAGWITFQFGARTALWLADGRVPTLTERFAGHALSFVVVMVSVMLVGALLKAAVHSVGLTGMDRLLGAALGLVRGAFVACLLVLLMGFTPLPREAAWQQSTLLPLLVPSAAWMRSKLPDWSVPDTDFRNAPGSGDNDGDQATSSPLLEGMVQQAIDTANRRVSQGTEGRSRSETDPANLEAGGQEPENLEASGKRSPGMVPASDPPSHPQQGRQRPGSQ